MATLAGIHIYPLKSGAPLQRDEALVEPRGLVHDRRWMVVDEQGSFLTARKHPRLTLIRAQPDGDWLTLDAPAMPRLQLKPAPDDRRDDVVVWDSTVRAAWADATAQAWISEFLCAPARFVFMDSGCARAIDPTYSTPGDEVSFADGYPLLLISQAALDHLNAKLIEPIPMLRFRPNLVVADTRAHAEDDWKRIRVGGIEFEIVKPCMRCTIPTIDIETGEFDPHGEPLRTLKTYRRAAKGVSFGQNLIPRGAGTLRLGDRVEVLG
ncbi:MAG: MOSC domain-containing protein [Rudaea sp.]